VTQEVLRDGIERLVSFYDVN